jgi:polyhydroxybutyrate depolymerase
MEMKPHGRWCIIAGMCSRLPSWLTCLVVLAVLVPCTRAADPARRAWTIDGVVREALVAGPASTPASAPAPLVFVFHGHGGTMGHAARTMTIHAHWPEAVVVFPQGLPTPGRLTDPEGKKAGWQREAGDQGDRDLKFVDAMLVSLRAERAIDGRRIYATGHSNGGSFTYLLWAERGSVFSAFAPSAAVIARGAGKLAPRPVLHLGSPQDPLVKWAWQSRMIDHVLAVNDCGPRSPDEPGYVRYEPRGKGGASVAVFIHDGGHGYPEGAPERIVNFFRDLTP